MDEWDDFVDYCSANGLNYATEDFYEWRESYRFDRSERQAELDFKFKKYAGLDH